MIVLIGVLSITAGGGWLVANGSIGEIKGSNSSDAVASATGASREAEDTAALVDALPDGKINGGKG